MPNNKVDQAPKIRSTGKKFLEGLSWGKAIRPHELETIFANCIDPKCFVQYKIMMFLTAQAEDDFGVALETVMTRLNISKDAYYKNRSLLGDGLYDKQGNLKEEGKHWLSCEDIGDKSYITIHYDKIYADGKKQCKFLNYPLEESNSQNTTVNKKEGYTDNYTEESNSQNTTEESNVDNYTVKESNCENTTVKECNSQNTTESTCEKSEESNVDNYYNNIREYDNKEYDKVAAREEFDKSWGNVLTGAAAMF